MAGALVGGLVVTVPTAVTGLLDWLTITRGTPLWRTAPTHLLTMLAATAVFLVAAIVGHAGYVDRDVSTAGVLLTLTGFALLTLGGWLGGTVVYVHGVRVLQEEARPAREAVQPRATGESGGASGRTGGRDRG